MTNLQEKIQKYLKSDRQWFSEHRKAHANLQLSKATDSDDILFWTGVLSEFSTEEGCKTDV